MLNSHLLLDHYDDHGNPRSFFLFWLSAFMLARSWVLFIAASVSNTQGIALLELFYPDKTALYSALALSFPVVVLMLFAGGLHRLPRFATHYWYLGKGILLIVVMLDLYFQLQFFIRSHWQFHLVSASTLVCSVWLFCYLIRSRRIAWLFQKESTIQ